MTTTPPDRSRLRVPATLTVALLATGAATALASCGPPLPAPIPENCRLVTRDDGGLACSNYQLDNHRYCIGPERDPSCEGDAGVCCQIVA